MENMSMLLAPSADELVVVVAVRAVRNEAHAPVVAARDVIFGDGAIVT